MKLPALAPRFKTQFVLFGGLSLALLNAMSPVEMLHPQALGQSSAVIAQSLPGSARETEEEINVRVYQAASPAVVTIDTPTGSGSGVIVESDGLILTNAHVIDGADSVRVFLSDGEEYQGRVVGYDAGGVDLAAVRIQGRGLPTVNVSSTPVQVGQRAFAIGNPFGRFNGTFTIGIVSRIDTTRGLIQTDAAINPGNSGGPLLNSRGELIGINTSIFTPQRSAPGRPDGPVGNIGIGFAITIEQVNGFLASVRNGSAPMVAQQSPFLRGSARPPQQITIGGSLINGQLSRNSSVLPADDSYYDAYSFEGRRGQQLLVEMNSSSVDAYLILLSPQGRDIAQDDDSGGNTNARLTYTLPENGTYTVLANSYSPRETGEYSLRVATATGNSVQSAMPVSGQSATTQNLPLRVEGILGSSSPVLDRDGSRYEEYEFDGSAGQQLRISLNSPDFDPFLVLMGPDGSVVGYNDDTGTSSLNSAMTVTLPSNGRYRVIANAFDSSGQGRFTLNVEPF